MARRNASLVLALLAATVLTLRIDWSPGEPLRASVVGPGSPADAAAPDPAPQPKPASPDATGPSGALPAPPESPSAERGPSGQTSGQPAQEPSAPVTTADAQPTDSDAAPLPDLTRPQWWPSEYGQDDQKGAANRLTPEKALEAAALIKTGTVVDMGRVVEADMPLFSLTPFARQYRLVIPGGPTYGPLGDNRLTWNEDYIAGEITQNGTQFDSLAHMGTSYKMPSGMYEVRYYNGWRQSEIADGHGFKKLGVENVPPIFTRGILVDIAAAIAPTKLDVGDTISVDDIKAALARQGLAQDEIRPGDALFINTGWGEYWKTNNEKFNSGIPGLSPEAGDWVAQQKVLLVGSDNWGVEAIPDMGRRLFAPNHQKFLVENGIYIMENIDFSGLIAKNTYLFAFSFGPIPFKGATGSPARPFAIF